MPQNRRNTRSTRNSDSLFGYLIPLVLVGLSIADFTQDGQIDKYLIGALLILGLGSLGYRVDTLIETYVQARAATAFREHQPEEAGNGA